MKIVRTNEDLLDLFDRGVSAEEAFEAASEKLEAEMDWPEESIKTLTILYEHGLPTEEIEEWIHWHFSGALCGDIVEKEPEAWEKLGIRADDYSDTWLALRSES